MGEAPSMEHTNALPYSNSAVGVTGNSGYIEQVNVANIINHYNTVFSSESLRGLLANFFTNRVTPLENIEAQTSDLLKSAVYKILIEYEKTFSQKRQDLNYYIPSNVVEQAPESMSVADYVRAIEKSENPPQSLLSAFNDFLNSAQSMMLLLGDPGAGKSLFAWHSSQSRLSLYKELFQNGEVTETPWVPLVIELKHYRLSELSDLLPRYLQETCDLTKNELAVLQNSQQIKYRLLIILDGFDELKQEVESQEETIKNHFHDCFKTCGAERWFSGQLKVAITCRVRYLQNTDMEKRYFGRGEQKIFYRRVLLPFNATQITAYLEERVKTQKEIKLLLVKDYENVIHASEAINAMVRNPFVLRLFVEALPELHKEGQNLKFIKRYDIYNAFVKQWFEREINKFHPAQREALGITASGMEHAILQQFIHYAGLLAVQMYQHDSLVVSYDRDHFNDETYRIWSRFDEIIARTELDKSVIEARLRTVYQTLTEIEKIDLEVDEAITDENTYVERKLPVWRKKHKNIVKAQLENFKISGPLRNAGDKHSFIHKSFYEFFLAQAILQNAGADQPLIIRVTNTLATLSATVDHELRRIQHEPEALQFLGDIWVRHNTDPVILRVKETCFAVIEASKGHPENGIAAANAVTILNWMSVMLTHKSWQDIHIPGANLSYAVLIGSNLSRANLRHVRLFHANLQDVNLYEADLTEVDFAERAPINSPNQAIAYHPKKPWLAIASQNTIRQYDIEHDQWIGKSLKHTLPISSITYSPDGQFLASSGFDKIIRQWRIDSGDVFGPELKGHTSFICSITYSPDGQFLASGSFDRTIRQWVAATGEFFGPTLIGHTAYVRRVVYSPDGKFLASASDDKTICQWVAATGLLFGPVLRGHTSEINSIAYSPDGKILASGSNDKTIRQWVVATGELFGSVLKGHMASVNSIAYSPDGQLLASGSEDCTIRQWVIETGKPFGRVLKGHTHSILSVVYSPDGQYLASASDDKTIRQWVATSNYTFNPMLMGHAYSVLSVAYSPNGKFVASAGEDCTIRQWNVETGELSRSVLGGRHSFTSVVYSPKGEYLACGNVDKKICQLIATTGQCFGPVLSVPGVTNVVPSFFDQCWVDIGVNKTTSRFDDETKKLFQSMETRYIGQALSVAYSPDGKLLASGSEGKAICQWVTATGEPFGSVLNGQTSSVLSIAYSPDGQYLASGGYEGIIRQWITATGEPFSSLPFQMRHNDSVTSIAYSPDGQYLASSSRDSTIRQWVTATGKPFGPVLKGHAGCVTSVIYSPNGQYLASGSWDNTIRLWMAISGDPLGPILMGHTSYVLSIAYSPDSQYLASGGADQCVCLWYVGSKKDFSLVWRTRSATNSLLATGLCLTGTVGLRNDQRALLVYAGYKETEQAPKDILCLSNQCNEIFSSSTKHEQAQKTPIKHERNQTQPDSEQYTNECVEEHLKVLTALKESIVLSGDWTHTCYTLFGYGYRFSLEKYDDFLKVARIDQHTETETHKYVLKDTLASCTFFMTSVLKLNVTTDSTERNSTLTGQPEMLEQAATILTEIANEIESSEDSKKDGVADFCRMS